MVSGRAQGSFQGRTALVTGSSRGIGLAIAKALSRAGAEIVVTARDAEGARGGGNRLAGRP
jgi:NAD(P)-dependent dehydrogenase (short-subunit alcohol dehydrogenase family)